MKPEPIAAGAASEAADELANFDAARAAEAADRAAVAAILEDVALSLVERRAPGAKVAVVALTCRVAAALVRRDAMPPTPAHSRTPDVEHLEDIADRLAELATPADSARAAVARRIAGELAASLLATRAAAQVWDAATAFASKGLAGSAGARQRFGDRMRAERNRRWPKLPEPFAGMDPATGYDYTAASDFPPEDRL